MHNQAVFPKQLTGDSPQERYDEQSFHKFIKLKNKNIMIRNEIEPDSDLRPQTQNNPNNQMFSRKKNSNSHKFKPKGIKTRNVLEISLKQTLMEDKDVQVSHRTAR